MKVSLIDYGTGNIHSLVKALEGGGATVQVDTSFDDVRAAAAIVLPGVGAFGAAAAGLSAGRASLQSAIQAGVPCLGICLGMQLLFEASEEGDGAGLGVLPGKVRRLRAHRLPHMGWNEVAMLDDPLFAGISSLTAYYANSYVVQPADESDVIGWTQYEHEKFPAAVRHDRVWGVQFHPEKSGQAGLGVIRNFLAQVGR
jgi:glutamine amidotransferase